MTTNEKTKRYFTPGIDPNEALPDLGNQRIAGDRFGSSTNMKLEWDKLWRKVWNPGPREEELPKPGDFIVHDIGKESLLFTRDNDGRIRGFYNVCQHRGNLLISDAQCGNRKFFQCGFHSWSYNLDGSIKGVPQIGNFPCGKADMASGKLDLVPVTVETWAGFIWFHLEQNPESLAAFLGEQLRQQLAPYRLQDMRLVEYKTFLWDANWKVACDAFNESYHFRGLHPQMLKWSDEVARIELLGEHSRMINKYGTTSSPYQGGDEIYDELREWMVYNGMNPDEYQGAPEDVWRAKVAFSRSLPDDGSVPVPYADMTDEQMTDVYHYFIFPAFAMNLFPEGANAFRYRPHPSDPGKMYYDLILLAHFPAGEVPPCEHKYFGEKVRYEDIVDTPISHIITDVLQQDADNVAINQAGLCSDGFKGMYLGEQELRLRHFHQTLDKYLAAPGK